MFKTTLHREPSAVVVMLLVLRISSLYSMWHTLHIGEVQYPPLSPSPCPGDSLPLRTISAFFNFEFSSTFSFSALLYFWIFLLKELYIF
jgi:hypothetical protein